MQKIQKNLGSTGESFFAAWCSQAGLTANPSSREDDRGWDYIVEFPFLQVGGCSADMQPSPIKCQVQVKSTDTTNRTKASIRSILLSNLHLLAKASMPTFFIFIEFQGKLEPQAAFLVHIDEKLIEEILKRIRTNENSDKPKKLNKCKLTINYDESHKLKSIDGIALKQAIETHVINMDTYVANKQNFLKSVGFVNGNVEMSFKLNKENLNNLIDAALGIPKEIEASDVQFSSTRFGIKGNPYTNEENALLSFDKQPKHRGKVRFKTDKFSAGLSFDGEMYLAPSFLLPEDAFAYRFKGDFFDLKVFDHSKSTLTFFDVEMNIAKLRSVIVIFRHIDEKNTLFVELENFSDLPTEVIEIKTDTLSGTTTPEEIELVQNASFLAEYFELEQELSISLRKLFQNKDQINALSKFLKSNLQPEMFVDLKQLDIDLSKTIACISFRHTDLGRYVVGVILGSVGRLEYLDEDEDKYRFLPYENDTKKIVITKENLISNKEEFDAVFDNFILEHYEGKDIQVIKTW
ncbi:MAG: hypothetical protein PHR16_02475 [Methylovulum sp.]|nr:hypothetical protein [Methylovulum sp.]